MEIEEIIPADDVKSYAASVTSSRLSEGNMPFRYEKIPFKLTNDEGVTITMGSNSLRDGWYTLIYHDDATEIAFKASAIESDEQGHARMRGRWEIAHLGETYIGSVQHRGFSKEERRRYFGVIAQALVTFPILNPQSSQFETCQDVHYVDAKFFGV